MTRYSYICQRTSLDELLMQGAVMCCSTTSPPSTLTTATEVRSHWCLHTTYGAEQSTVVSPRLCTHTCTCCRVRPRDSVASHDADLWLALR